MGCDPRETTHPVSACRELCSSASREYYERCVAECVEDLRRRCAHRGMMRVNPQVARILRPDR
ncbi:MAG: hypothetical protein ACP5NG_03225 [Conexivisphaera sp.]